MEPADADLYAQARAGDSGALDTLLARYLPQLHSFVRVRLQGAVRARESSLDVVQSVCRELLSHREHFDFRGEERFRAWLFTSALNKLREKHRFHRAGRRDLAREAAFDDDGALQRAFAQLTPSLDAIGRETAQALRASLDALSDEHREVITLARIVRLPHAVIAEFTGRSEPAVRQLLARALLRLARELRARGITLS